MRAVDTNVLARLILGDDEEQARHARDVALAPIWVSPTVWIELGWVLGKRLGLDRAIVAEALGLLLTMETLHTPDRAGIGWAIARYREGADWADMVHLVTAHGVADGFATFDRKLARDAGDAPPLAIETLA